MLHLWLKPVSLSFTKTIPSDIHQDSLYHHLQIHTDNKFPSLENTKIAIIGISKNSNIIREALYSLIWHFEQLQIADLGNIRNSDDNSVTQLLCELTNVGIVPMIIGDNKVQAVPQFLAHKKRKTFTNLAVISENIPCEKNTSEYILKLLQDHKSSIFNIGFLSYQCFYCSPQQIQWIEQQKYDGMRLGSIRADIEDAEPIIRDADTLFFQLDAINAADSPAVERPTPNGLRAEEACQLSRYAGMSDKLSSFSISGFMPKNDIHGVTAQLIAQMIWYFFDGFHQRKQDFPISNTNMTEYVVDFKHFEYQITFWKSNKSGRWWMQIPLQKNTELTRHQLVPCSYKDYQKACSGELPQRLFTALERF